MEALIINNPIVQAGFAGAFVLMLVTLIWVLRNVFKTSDKVLEVISVNTKAFTELTDCIIETKSDGDERKDLIIHLTDVTSELATTLKARPCLLCDVQEIREAIRKIAATGYIAQ